MKACGQQRHLVCPHQSMPAPKLGAASQRGGHSTFPWPADMKHWPPAVRARAGDPQGSSRNRSDPGCGVVPRAEHSGPGLVNWATAGPMGDEISRSLPPGPPARGNTCSCSTPGPGPGPGPGPPRPPQLPPARLSLLSPQAPRPLHPLPQAGWHRPTPALLIGSAVANVWLLPGGNGQPRPLLTKPPCPRARGV